MSPQATPRPVMHPADGFAVGFALTALAIAAAVLVLRRVLG